MYARAGTGSLRMNDYEIDLLVTAWGEQMVGEPRDPLAVVSPSN